MDENRCLALLLCDRASQGENGKVNLYGVFDRIEIPRGTAQPRGGSTLFFVFYNVYLIRPCTPELSVLDPERKPVQGPRRDTIEGTGLTQTVWSLNHTDFEKGGNYRLPLFCDSIMLAEAYLEVSESSI